MSWLRLFRQTLTLTMLAAALTVAFVDPASASECEIALRQVVHPDGPPPEFDGNTGFITRNTEASVTHLLNQRQKLKAMYQYLVGNLFDMDSFIRIHLMSGIGGYSVFASGGPGAAKTLVPDLMFGKELWKIQGRENTKLLEVIGGGKTENSAKGEYAHYFGPNTMVHFLFALFDEIEKTNPEILNLLLGPMNPGERRILVEGREFRINTRSFLFTSNLTSPQFVESLLRNGMIATALAFFNRVHFKLRYNNLLESRLLARLMALQEERRTLKATASHPNATRAKERLREISLPDSDIDWLYLHWYVQTMFRHTDASYRIAAEAGEKYGLKQLELMKEWAADGGRDEFENYPTSEITTRLMVEVPDVIKTSLFLDLLLSELPDQELKEIFAMPVEVTEASFWRAAPLMTATVPGRTVYDYKNGSMLYGLEFKDGVWRPRTSDFLTRRAGREKDVTSIANEIAERKTFNEDGLKPFQDDAELAKELAALMPANLRPKLRDADSKRRGVTSGTALEAALFRGLNLIHDGAPGG
jgi:hypothetical protein